MGVEVVVNLLLDGGSMYTLLKKIPYTQGNISGRFVQVAGGRSKAKSRAVLVASKARA